MAERRIARLPVTPAATAQALAYQAALGPLLKALEKLVEQLLSKVAPTLARADSRVDAGERDLRRLIADFKGSLDAEIQSLLGRLEKMLAARSEQVDRVGLATLKRQLQAAMEAAVRVAPDLPRDALATVMARVAGTTKARAATRERWVAANLELIQGLGVQAAKRVGQLVRDAASGGTRIETLARQLQEQVGVSQRRAALLARDQTTKLASQVNEAQQRDLGAKRYIWRHSGIRVGARPEHLARDGKVFFWERPPPGGPPGAEPNCRCTAEPLVEELLGPVMQHRRGRPLASK